MTSKSQQLLVHGSLKSIFVRKINITPFLLFHIIALALLPSVVRPVQASTPLAQALIDSVSPQVFSHVQELGSGHAFTVNNITVRIAYTGNICCGGIRIWDENASLFVAQSNGKSFDETSPFNGFVTYYFTPFTLTPSHSYTLQIYSGDASRQFKLSGSMQDVYPGGKYKSGWDDYWGSIYCFLSFQYPWYYSPNNCKEHPELADIYFAFNDPIVLAGGFDYPVGPRSPDGLPYLTEKSGDADGWYNAQDFLESCHLGEDWNMEGCGTDEGQPVYAAASGVVVAAEAQCPLDSCGPLACGQDPPPQEPLCGDGVIRILHTAPSSFTVPGGSSVLQVVTAYAHLNKNNLLVAQNEWVVGGQQIGEIGPRSCGSSGSHLHFEVRTVPNIGIGPGYSCDPSVSVGWTDPSDFIDANRPATRELASGQNITAVVIASPGNDGGVEATFDDTMGGRLSGAYLEIPSIDLGSVLPAPFNFSVPSSPVKLWNLEYSGQFTNFVTLTFGFLNNALSLAEKVRLRIKHYDGSNWVELGGPGPNGSQVVDPVNNTITVQTTSFSTFVLGQDDTVSDWEFFGTAHGGTIDFTVNGVALQVITIAGQTADQVAAAVAAAINGNTTLASMGVTASANGSQVTTNGTITSVTNNDPGITQDLPTIPTVSFWGAAALVGMLAATGILTGRRRLKTQD